MRSYGQSNRGGRAARGRLRGAGVCGRHQSSGGGGVFGRANRLEPICQNQNRVNKSSKSEPAGEAYLKQSPAARAERPNSTDWGLGDGHISKLLPYPDPYGPGVQTPFDLHLYGGKGISSWGSPQLPMAWDDWVEHCETQKPKLMAEWNRRMNERYDFHAPADSRGDDVRRTEAGADGSGGPAVQGCFQLGRIGESLAGGDRSSGMYFRISRWPIRCTRRPTCCFHNAWLKAASRTSADGCGL